MRTTTLLKWYVLFSGGLAFSADDPLSNENEIKRSATMITIEIVDKEKPDNLMFSNCFYYIFLTSSPLSYMAFYGSQLVVKKKYTKDKDA
ncbi:MAG: hypothetical protein WCJ92_06500 [Alphaproteobacteria bacterium]